MKVRWTVWHSGIMSKSPIQQVFQYGREGYQKQHRPSAVQRKTIYAITACKSGSLGSNISICDTCGHVRFHHNSCRNRNCPNCQAVQNELWIDKRRAEVIDAPYFHLVFTLPSELNPLVYANQALLYDLLHKCAAETILELSADAKYLGALPGIIQVLHTWGQALNYHPHIHAIVSGAGITRDLKLRQCGNHFFLPSKVLGRKFRGKFLSKLKSLYDAGRLRLPDPCKEPGNWDQFINRLYSKEWHPDIRETFRGKGNAIDYLGRYTNRIAISNARIKSVTPDAVTFSAKNYRKEGRMEEITISCTEFVRRFMMHVLPAGFQKIRYYGFLGNRKKKANLKRIFALQGKALYLSKFAGLSNDEVLKILWGYDVHVCPKCQCHSMYHIGRTFRQQE